MQIVSLAQQKGGCAKSCTAIHLTRQAIISGHNATLLDMDYKQATSCKWGERRGDPLIVRKVETNTLADSLESLRADGMNWAFLDLPGRDAWISDAGIAESDLVLIPCRPTEVDLEASISTVRSAKHAKVPYAFLMNVAPPKTQRSKRVLDLLKESGHMVCPIIIVSRLQVPDAITLGKTVDETLPSGESAKEFKKLFKWITKTLETH